MNISFQKQFSVFILLLLSIGISIQAHGPTDYSALFEEASQSVVSVNSVTVLDQRNNPFPFFFGVPPDNQLDSPFRSSGVGSGVIISSDGYILTNAHVILNSDSSVVDNVEIVMHDKRKLSAKVIGFDVYSDVALLKVDSDTPLPVAKIGNSNNVKVGHVVLAIGHPLGLNYTLTSGVISSLNRSIRGGDGTERFVPFIQTDAAINPGNSGGPLLNVRGEVIGINSRIIGGRTGSYIGYSLAIPINLAMDVQDKLRIDGTIRRGMLGVTFDPKGIDEADIKVWGLDPDITGVLINSVIEGSGADEGGLEPGDAIIGYDNNVITDPNDFPRFIANTEPGSEVPIELIRGGERLTLSVTIGAIDDGGLLAKASGGKSNQKPFGMVLSELSIEQKQSYGINDGVLLRGFDDENEEIEIPQELFKLRANDIILGVIISGKLEKVQNPNQLRDLLSGLEELGIDTIGFQILRGNNRRPFFVTVSLNS